MNKEKFIAVIRLMAKQIEENKIYLTQLDADIGDGDHGINMARGFSKIVEILDTSNGLSIADIFSNISKTLIYICAGTSGPLYGLLFKAGATVCLNKEEISIQDLVDILDNGINKIKAIGGANLLDKTMLDSMIPCLESLKKSNKSSKEALLDAYNASIEGRDKVINLIAKKGRASCLGERSIGHIDPGCESFCILFKCICDLA